MITAEEVLNYPLQKAGMNGYRAVEVDQLITNAAETLRFQERKIRDLESKISELKKNETIIQTTLINAQKLAMQITDEAKQSAQSITGEAEAKATAELSDAENNAAKLMSVAESNARQLTEKAESDADATVGAARAKAEKMLADAELKIKQMNAQYESDIAHQNKVLDALKTEVAKFRSEVLNMYKAQVTLIRDLPDKMPEQPVFVKDEIAQAEEAPAEQPAEQPTNDLMKLIGDMKENEEQAAAAVDEVASFAEAQSETAVEPEPEKPAEPEPEQQTLDEVALSGLRFNVDDDAADDSEPDDIPTQPLKKREGGFNIVIDDED